MNQSANSNNEIAIDGVISTLGPVGTDSAHEASKRSPHVLLFPSFPKAVEHALESNGHALVPAGYLHLQDGTLADSWVDLHFRMLDRLRVVDVWKSSTRPMCLAVNSERAFDFESVRSIASHPATALFARQSCPNAEITFVSSKPLAVELAASGRVDACIGSADVVTETRLHAVKHFHPTMVWVLYKAVQETSLAGGSYPSIKRVSEEN